MNARGRPKTSRLTRPEQLRRAKRAQRRRERAAGLMQVQLRLPGAVARKLAVAARSPGFAGHLDQLLDQAVIRVADHPALAELCWNRTEEYLPAREAFALYERNWRFVIPDQLGVKERALIEDLAARFGAGIVHG